MYPQQNPARRRLDKKPASRLLLQLILVSLLIASHSGARAQGRATIFGAVVDPSGAAVSGAAITVTNTATQEIRRTVSDGKGEYVVPDLEPGTYNLTAAASGFEGYIQKGIKLEVDENRRSSVQLSVGATAQQVVVNDDTVQVDTRSSTISEVVDSDRVKDLPLNGRNALQLQNLVAGAGAISTGGGGQAENSVTAINGARQAENNYTLDGADNEDPFFFTPSVFPNPDALAEFSLQTSNYAAQSGLGSGAQMNAITKSGTNAFHGTLFEYVRNQMFDATGYFAKVVPPFHQNQFGGTIGGPVWKDHSFFFFAYQGTRQRSSPSAETLTVPDAAERGGNFSEITKQLNYPGTATPVPGNIFPASSLSPASQAFLSTFVPLPNSANNIYSYSANTLMNDDQYIGRLDTSLSANDQLSGRILSDANVQNSLPSTNDLPGFVANIDYVNWNLAVNETHTFSADLLNQFTFGFNDIQRVQTPIIPVQKTWGDLGAGVVRAASGPIGYDTEIQSYFTAESRWPLSQYRHGYQFSDTVSWTRNAHTIYLGGDLRRSYTHQFQDYIADGQFIFSAVYTGNQLADFETGHEATFTQDSYNAGEPVNLLPDLFVQDDWKVSRRLTLNSGVRWNPFVPYHDQLNAVSQFIPGEKSTVYPTAPVGYVFPGDAGVSQNTISTRWHDFAPRVGFAYDVFGDGKTSLRGGYGIFYAFVREQALNNLSSNQPFGIALSVTQPSGGMANPYSNTGNPFPYVPPQTEQEKETYAFNLPLTLTVWQPSFRDGRVQQWNLNLQQQVSNWVFTIAYVGSVGEHLFLQFERDPAVYGAPGNTTEARRIFAPNFGSITTQFSGGHSTYHALQLSANRRLSKGLTVLANYTWSKSLDNGSSDTSSPFDPFNISSNRGLSDFDIPQSLVTSFIWRLPETSTHNYLVKNLVNGWQTTGILTLQKGIPFSVTSGVDNSQSGVGADLADLIGNPHIYSYSSKANEVAKYFNTSAYKVNALGTFGDSGRNRLIGPGIENIDFAVLKSLYSSERVRTVFRGEAFNLFNHTNLGQPVSNFSSSTFGQINSLNTNSNPRVLQLALRAEF
jgi:Carboxypeptidase regulatory-like domain